MAQKRLHTESEMDLDLDMMQQFADREGFVSPHQHPSMHDVIDNDLEMHSTFGYNLYD